MSFLRYPHLVKYGHSDVEAIEFGTTYIFPKLDGTNASIWLEDGKLCTGSRNRELTKEGASDNAGFNAWVQTNTVLRDILIECKDWILYGEWLVPHTVQHYHDNAWRKFYIFDVYDTTSQNFLPYDDYQSLLDKFGVDYVPCIKKIRNGSWENFLHEAKVCRYLLKDEVGQPGEGIVIKNYEWVNKHQNQIWAKIVNAEFKDDFHKAMGASIVEGKSPAQTICDMACTDALIEKEYAKIVVAEQDSGGWNNRHIPRLLNTAFHCVVTEELWDCLKEMKFNGLVNFKELQQLCFQRVKHVKKELF